MIIAEVGYAEAPIQSQRMEEQLPAESIRDYAPHTVNPRYWAFLQVTRSLEPGLMGIAYMKWVIARWSEFRSAVGLDEAAPANERLHEDFDRWLLAYVDQHSMRPRARTRGQGPADDG